MVEHDKGFLAAELGVAHVDAGILLQLAGVAGLAAVDHIHAVRVGRAGKGYRPILIRFAHRNGGHEDVPVRVDRAGLVALRSADHDAVRAAFDHMDEHVRIGLLMRRLGAVALGVGHRSVHGQILVLHHGQEILEVFMVVGAVLFVYLIGGGENGVEAVHAHAALEAAGGLLSEQALHLDLFHQVVRRLVQVGEAVDLVPGQAGGGGHQVGILRVLSQLIGHGDAVDRGADHWMIHPVLDLLAEHIYTGFQRTKAVNVFLCSFHRHFSVPPDYWFARFS